MKSVIKKVPVYQQRWMVPALVSDVSMLICACTCVCQYVHTVVSVSVHDL